MFRRVYIIFASFNARRIVSEGASCRCFKVPEKCLNVFRLNLYMTIFHFAEID